jgi:hypothetical protein
LIFLSGGPIHEQRRDVLQASTKHNVVTEEGMDEIGEVVVIQITKFLPWEQRTDEKKNV